MVRNFLRSSVLIAFDMTAGLAFIAVVVSCLAVAQVMMYSSSRDEDFWVNLSVWMAVIAAGLGWIYFFSVIRDRVRAFVLQVI